MCPRPPETADGPDLDSFPLVRRGHRLKDFEVGQRWQHHWGRTLTAADNVYFSTATCSWLPLHLNVEYARSQGHGDVVLHPMLVLATAVGLSAEDLSESGGPLLGLEDCLFGEPMYPGDTLAVRSTVISKRVSTSNPGRGVVAWRTTGENQHGETVVEFVRTNLIAAGSGDGVLDERNL